MKHSAIFQKLPLLLLLIITISACAQNRPQIIFDTDFGGDADDLGALVMLHNFMNRGECDLLAVMCWNTEKYSVSAVDAVNRYYGHPDIPVGTRKGDFEPIDWNHSRVIADQFPYELDGTKAKESTQLYRELLAARDDKDVTIVTVGPLSNIKRLLESKPDEISPLDGNALIEAKVTEFIIMGGQFPSGEKEWNFDGNMPGVTKYVVEHLTVPITFSGYEVGLDIKSGEVFNDIDKNSPLHVGFMHFCQYAPWLKQNWEGTIYDNSTYDQTAVLYAVRGGIDNYWSRIEGGYCLPDDVGGNQWIEGGSKPHSYLKLIKSNEEMAEIIEGFMVDDFR
ncbi:MAG: nucleoside hydrolase [Bacteroidota bacterium]